MGTVYSLVLHIFAIMGGVSLLFLLECARRDIWETFKLHYVARAVRDARKEGYLEGVQAVRAEMAGSYREQAAPRAPEDAPES